MSRTKCSSENPATCRYHGHDAQVELVKKAQRKAEVSQDFEGYVAATKTLEALSKRQQIIAGIDASLQEAVTSGDFSKYLSLAENFEKMTTVGQNSGKAAKVEPKSTAKVTALSDLVGSDGETYVSGDSIEVSNGAYAPDRIHSINEYGERVAFVKADIYDHHDYPDVLRIQASRPLTDDEVQRVAQATGYQYRSTLGGEGLSDPERDGNASVIVGSDMTKAAGRKSRLPDFEDGLESTLQEGSAIRKTDRSGPGTKGTRLVNGLGKELTFSLYYQDDSVKFDN